MENKKIASNNKEDKSVNDERKQKSLVFRMFAETHTAGML